MFVFKNLRAEMARQGLTNIQVAKAIEVSEKTFRNKMYGRTEFTRSEMLKIQKSFFPNLTLDYLFEFDEKTA